MFRQNAQVPQNLKREHEEKEYFLLYYQFIKHAFGIDYCNTKEKDYVVLKLYFDKLPDTKKIIKSLKVIFMPLMIFSVLIMFTFIKKTLLKLILKNMLFYNAWILF